jgi:hypothetical protein
MIPPDLAFIHPSLDSIEDSDEEDDGVWHKPPVPSLFNWRCVVT